ncbi:hypothetical protein BIY24_12215 [Halobacteriovorax marinus]|uniref:Exported protein n=1 Tax=Halobacteriovorax marinus (strain ATCC BAA-682 / DSM 15412 / SJ) TaxID=862908 RepID=E1X638_HALMS|nr:hypothetical protein [Halobacteriovorax marinus]ATH08684.1 hypothetical protein BIY24_12215 [Halobacteriovorax marinus]CBW27382.1 putative exported protein [Halobacteriovorax marinus SJ]
MKFLMTCFFLLTFISNLSAAESNQKQRPFNDEGPICKEGCGNPDRLRAVSPYIILTKDTAPKPPFNDEGPGGKKG